MSTDLEQPDPTAPAPGAPARGATSVAAVVGLVAAFVFWPVGLVASIVGILHTRPGGKAGRGLAVAGVVVSGLSAVATAVVLVLGASLLWGATSAPAGAQDPVVSAQGADAAPTADPAVTADPAQGADQQTGPTEETGAAGGAQAWDDAVLDTCQQDDAGALTASVTVTNSTGAPASYTVAVGFDDLEGNVVGRAAGQVAQVAPGATAVIDAQGAAGSTQGELECYLDDVVRLAA